MLIYRREIDGLRALAVLAVILFHAGITVFSGGFAGVDVFFVISGYLITSIILTEKETGTFSLSNFYERRIRRILPALFVVIFTSIPFAWLWLSPYDMKEFARSIRYVSLFFSNILFYRESDYFDTEADLKPLLHTWSLSVEEQYYVIFPLLLLIIWKISKSLIPYSLVLIATISLFYAEHMVIDNQNAAFFLLPSRTWELMIGAFLAYITINKKIEIKGNQPLSLVGLLLLLCSIFLLSDKTPFPGLYALIPTISAALIILFATKETIVGRMLGSKLPVGIGLISYSAYLWHQVIFALFRHQSLSKPNGFTMSLLIAITLSLAYLSWRFIEQPFRQKEFVSKKAIYLIAITGSAFLIVFGFIGQRTEGFEQRYPQKILEPINKAVSFKSNILGCWKKLKANPDINHTCILGSDSEITSFALIGDSHAASLATSLNESASRNNLSGRNFTYSACQSVLNKPNQQFANSLSTCEQFREDLFKNLNFNAVPKTLILSQRWTLMIQGEAFNNQEGGIEKKDAAFEKAYKKSSKVSRMRDYAETIKTLLANGKKIVLIYPIPEMGWNVPKRMLRLYSISGKITKEDASVSHEVFKERNKNAYLALDNIGAHKNLIRIYPEDILCDTYIAKRCAAHLNGKPLYRDDDHLSKLGADLVISEVMKKLNWK